MNLGDIDLNLLVVLDALLQEEHVTKAGERLGLSQSATSRALKKLRVLFEDDLLIKGHQGMNLSTKATQLRPAVAQSLQELTRLFAPLPTFEPSSFDGEIWISAGPWVSDTLLTTLLRVLHEDAPGARLRATRAEDPPHPHPVDAHLDLRWSDDVSTSSQTKALRTSRWRWIHAGEEALEEDLVPGTTWVGVRHHPWVVPDTTLIQVATAEQVYKLSEQLKCPGLVLEDDCLMRADLNDVEWMATEMVPGTIATLCMRWCLAPSMPLQQWLTSHIVQCVEAWQSASHFA